MDNNTRWKPYSNSKGDDFPYSSKLMELQSPKEELSFCRGDRVLVLLDGIEEFGWVRWIGRSNLEEFVGVEFDNPIGNDNHKTSSGHTLFEAPPQHASVVPASSLLLAEEYLDSTYPTSRHCSIKKHSKNESALGSDMSSLSTFHKMAFEQLSGSQKPLNIKPYTTGNPHTRSSSYGEKENWDYSHGNYSSQKNILGSRETLNDLKSKSVKGKGKGFSMVTALLDEKKSGGALSPTTTSSTGAMPPASSKATPRPSSLHPSRDHPNIGVSGGGIIGGSDCDDLDSPTDAYHPLIHLSLHGVDQLEVISDDPDSSHFGTPDSSIKDDDELGIGSLVEVTLGELQMERTWKPLFGVIRWIGSIPGEKKDDRKIAGIEMEDADDGLCDGTLKGKRHFSCPSRKGLFVALQLCAKDSRFLESVSSNPRSSLAFGSTDCQPVTGNVPPLSSFEEVRAMFGRNKGIQGHQNSCYLDATLFSMFAFTSVFDGLLFRPPTPHDILEYNDVQTVLKDEIVNPLRRNMYVRADRIMKLRTLLDHLSSVRGLTTEEKDPEEFLQSLLAQILQAEPFLQLSSGQEAYHYQLFVDKDDKLNLPSVQTLFDQSFLTSDIKLKQIPSCLIIQMPRFGKDYKMYPRILPSMVLDVTDVIEDSPRQCIICGKLAEYECRECYGHCGSGLESIAFCAKCMDKAHSLSFQAHSHKKRGSHSSTRKLKIPPEFQMLADHCGSIPRVYMELFAVVCIETSHYVTFTRCGSGPDATWCFFDSMADRKGEQHGYNIPNVVECGDLMQWVGEESGQMLHTVTDNKALPDLPRRLLCDAYMCFYQSPKVMMYT